MVAASTLDIEFHADCNTNAKRLARLRETNQDVKVLGEKPRALHNGHIASSFSLQPAPSWMFATKGKEFRKLFD
jgi:hypothetical protein